MACRRELLQCAIPAAGWDDRAALDATVEGELERPYCPFATKFLSQVGRSQQDETANRDLFTHQEFYGLLEGVSRHAFIDTREDFWVSGLQADCDFQIA